MLGISAGALSEKKKIKHTASAPYVPKTKCNIQKVQTLPTAANKTNDKTECTQAQRTNTTTLRKSYVHST